MIKITNKDLNNYLFSQAMYKLGQFDTFDIKPAYQISRLRAKVASITKEQRDLMQTLVKKYAVLNDKGEIAFNEQNGYDIPADKKDAFEAEMREYMTIEHQISVWPITFAQLDKANALMLSKGKGGLTPDEIMALENVLDVSELETDAIRPALAPVPSAGV